MNNKHRAFIICKGLSLHPNSIHLPQASNPTNRFIIKNTFKSIEYTSLKNAFGIL